MTGGERVDAVDQELPLPGLAGEPDPGASDLELSARRTLAQLHADGLLGERDAVRCQLLLDLCAGYSASVRQARGKVTVAASAVAAQIQNLLGELIPERADAGDDDAFDQLAADLRAAHAEALAQLQERERGEPAP